jgi:hypothetical protein
MFRISPLELIGFFRLRSSPWKVFYTKKNCWVGWSGSSMIWLEKQQTLLLAMSDAVPQVGDASFQSSSLRWRHIGRALMATISLRDHEKITALKGDFGKLKEDFDRAVNVEALTLARKNGKYWPYFVKAITDVDT